MWFFYNRVRSIYESAPLQYSYSAIEYLFRSESRIDHGLLLHQAQEINYNKAQRW